MLNSAIKIYLHYIKIVHGINKENNKDVLDVHCIHFAIGHAGFLLRNSMHFKNILHIYVLKASRALAIKETDWSLRLCRVNAIRREM